MLPASALMLAVMLAWCAITPLNGPTFALSATMLATTLPNGLVTLPVDVNKRMLPMLPLIADTLDVS